MPWSPDPYGTYDLRWFEDGRPTAWVMDRHEPPRRDPRQPGPQVPPYLGHVSASSQAVEGRTAPHWGAEIVAVSVHLAIQAVKASLRMIRPFRGD
jgi:hypothetical protein